MGRRKLEQKCWFCLLGNWSGLASQISLTGSVSDLGAALPFPISPFIDMGFWVKNKNGNISRVKNKVSVCVGDDVLSRDLFAEVFFSILKDGSTFGKGIRLGMMLFKNDDSYGSEIHAISSSEYVNLHVAKLNKLSLRLGHGLMS